MNDNELIEEIYRRFHAAAEETFAARIMNLRIDDLPFVNPDGTPFGNVMHLVRDGKDKSGAFFDIYRLGWFQGRLWELVIVDGVYLSHSHPNIDSEFIIMQGGGHLSHDDLWGKYEKRTRTTVGRGIGHAFITDPALGPTVFISIQSDPIRQIIIDQGTGNKTFVDDFVYVDDKYPLPPHLLAERNGKMAPAPA